MSMKRKVRESGYGMAELIAGLAVVAIAVAAIYKIHSESARSQSAAISMLELDGEGDSTVGISSAKKAGKPVAKVPLSPQGMPPNNHSEN